MRGELTLVVDLTGKIVLANDKAKRVFGYTTNEITSMYVNHIFSRRDTSRLMNMAEKAISNGKDGVLKLNIISKEGLSRKSLVTIEESHGYLYLGIDLQAETSKVNWYASRTSIHKDIIAPQQWFSGAISFL